MRATEAARDRVAFYGSTEAYKPVFEVHGWGDLQVELNKLNKRQQKEEMAALISDEVLHTIAILESRWCAAPHQRSTPPSPPSAGACSVC